MVTEKSETVSSQRGIAKGQEAMGTCCSPEIVTRQKEKISSFVRVVQHCNRCPGRPWDLCPSRLLKPAWTKPWAIWSSCGISPALSRDWTRGLQKFLPPHDPVICWLAMLLIPGDVTCRSKWNCHPQTHGQERGGFPSSLWAVRHFANKYLLVLWWPFPITAWIFSSESAIGTQRSVGQTWWPTSGYS